MGRKGRSGDSRERSEREDTIDPEPAPPRSLPPGVDPAAFVTPPPPPAPGQGATGQGGEPPVDPKKAKRMARNAARRGGGGGGGGGDKGGGGGGGGGGGRAGIGSGGYHAKDIGEDLNQMIKENLMDRISGKEGSMSDEQVSKMKQQLFESTQGQVKRGRMAAYSDAARRGIFRTGVTSGAVSDIEQAGVKAYSSGVRDILLQKAQMDWQDKIKAIDSAQVWLNGVRQYELGKEQNAIAREQIKATIEAASIQASAQRYAADQGLKGARAAAGASRAAAKMAHSANLAFSAEGVPLTAGGQQVTMNQWNFMQGN